MSETRKKYILRLVGRSLVFVAALWAAHARPDWFAPLEAGAFFQKPTPLHLLWCIWLADMFFQILPVKNRLPLGSQKLWQSRFRPIRERFNLEALRRYMVTTSKAAYKVLILWCLLIAGIGWLHLRGILSAVHLFLISVCFYVCDLICVLIWCPFRLMMRTRCCTTCRIFNWDHLMMFSPLVFVPGFYAKSLFWLAVLAWVVWEACILLYPERFWEGTNAALRCSECTDKLCTQYCRKLRTL